MLLKIHRNKRLVVESAIKFLFLVTFLNLALTYAINVVLLLQSVQVTNHTEGTVVCVWMTGEYILHTMCCNTRDTTLYTSALKKIYIRIYLQLEQMKNISVKASANFQRI